VHALTRALPWAGVWPSRLFGRPCLKRHVSCVLLWTHAGADFQTFRREDSAHHNSHLRALDSSQELGERHDRRGSKHRGRT